MLYAYVGTALVALAVGFGGGWTTQGWRHGAAENKAVINAQAKARLQRQGADAGARQFETVREKIRTEYIPIKEEVERVVIQYRDRECFAADGLRLINEAVRAANNPGKPIDAVPAPAGDP